MIGGSGTTGRHSACSRSAGSARGGGRLSMDMLTTRRIGSPLPTFSRAYANSPVDAFSSTADIGCRAKTCLQRAPRGGCSCEVGHPRPNAGTLSGPWRESAPFSPASLGAASSADIASVASVVGRQTLGNWETDNLRSTREGCKPRCSFGSRPLSSLRSAAASRPDETNQRSQATGDRTANLVQASHREH